MMNECLSCATLQTKHHLLLQNKFRTIRMEIFMNRHAFISAFNYLLIKNNAAVDATQKQLGRGFFFRRIGLINMNKEMEWEESIDILVDGDLIRYSVYKLSFHSTQRCRHQSNIPRHAHTASVIEIHQSMLVVWSRRWAPQIPFAHLRITVMFVVHANRPWTEKTFHAPIMKSPRADQCLFDLYDGLRILANIFSMLPSAADNSMRYSIRLFTFERQCVCYIETNDMHFCECPSNSRPLLKNHRLISPVITRRLSARRWVPIFRFDAFAYLRNWKHIEIMKRFCSSHGPKSHLQTTWVTQASSNERMQMHISQWSWRIFDHPIICFFSSHE